MRRLHGPTVYTGWRSKRARKQLPNRWSDASSVNCAWRRLSTVRAIGAADGTRIEELLRRSFRRGSTEHDQLPSRSPPTPAPTRPSVPRSRAPRPRSARRARCQARFRSPRSLVFRMPPVCFIHLFSNRAFQIAGLDCLPGTGGFTPLRLTVTISAALPQCRSISVLRACASFSPRQDPRQVSGREPSHV